MQQQGAEGTGRKLIAKRGWLLNREISLLRAHIKGLQMNIRVYKQKSF
ncbi:hypothetical protein ACFMB7_25965 [Bacillus toyonensis]